MVAEKLAGADETDKTYQTKIDKKAEEDAKTSGFKKLMPYNSPKFLLVTACFGALINGASQPFLGAVFAKLLSLLTVPLWMFEAEYGPNYL